MLQALQALSPKTSMPRPENVKLLNWQTGQAAQTVAADALVFDGCVLAGDATSAPLILCGDWCTESSFEGCAKSAEAASKAVLVALSSRGPSVTVPQTSVIQPVVNEERGQQREQKREQQRGQQREQEREGQHQAGQTKRPATASPPAAERDGGGRNTHRQRKTRKPAAGSADTDRGKRSRSGAEGEQAANDGQPRRRFI
jgi:hypothetical protein